MATDPMTPTTMRRDRRLAKALATLGERDPDFAAALAIAGLPPVRRQETGFPGLLRIIMGQQISVAAARAIRVRLEAAIQPLAPEVFLAASDPDLRAVGLSTQKIKYSRALAEAVASGRYDFAAIDRMPDEAIVERLVALPGIGRWTAEVYLLFSLQRPDVWPAGDLAMRGGLKRLKRLRTVPDEKRTRRIGEAWRPHRSAAARFLWHIFNHPGL